MKLKKAMRLYPISYYGGLYWLGDKRIIKGPENWGGWDSDGKTRQFDTEREAVSWLIEGAERRRKFDIFEKPTLPIGTTLDMTYNHIMYRVVIVAVVT